MSISLQFFERLHYVRVKQRTLRCSSKTESGAVFSYLLLLSDQCISFCPLSLLQGWIGDVRCSSEMESSHQVCPEPDEDGTKDPKAYTQQQRISLAVSPVISYIFRDLLCWTTSLQKVEELLTVGITNNVLLLSVYSCYHNNCALVLNESCHDINIKAFSRGCCFL